MSLLARLIAAAGGGSTTPPPTGSPRAYLLITTGQSNEQCADFFSGDGSMPVGWLAAQADILIYTWGAIAGAGGNPAGGYQNPGAWAPMRANVNTMSQPIFDGYAPGVKTGFWGPEQALAHDVLDAIQADPDVPADSIVAVFKVAEGGIAISHWQSGGDKRALFNTHLAVAIGALQTDGYEVVPVAMRWGQGEENAGEATAVYQPKLEEVISHIRSRHALLSALPVVMQRLSVLQTAKTVDQRATINDAFENVASTDAHAYVLDPDDFAIGVETSTFIHYLADSKLLLGHETFNLLHTAGIV